MRLRSVLDHLDHLLFLVLHVLLRFLFLVLLALLGRHPLELGLLFLLLLAEFLELLFLLAVVLLLGGRVGRLLAVAFALGTGGVAQLQTHNLVNHSENHLEHSESLLHGFLGAADFDLGTHEDWVLVVDLLVSNVKLKQAVTILLKDFTDGLIDQLVGNFFVLTQNDEVVFLGLLTSLLLVGRRLWHGQVVGADGEHHVLEVLVDIMGLL